MIVGFEPTTDSSEWNCAAIAPYRIFDGRCASPRRSVPLSGYRMLHTFICFPCQVLAISGNPRSRRSVSSGHGFRPWLTTSDYESLSKNPRARRASFTLPGACPLFLGNMRRYLTRLHRPFLARQRSIFKIVWVDPCGRWLSSHL